MTATTSTRAQKTRAQRWVLVLSLVITLVLIARFLVMPAWMPTAIAYAPNFGKSAELTEATNSDLPACSGVSRQLRVVVGPPQASLSIWVMENSLNLRKPKGTVLLLHGIRDSKLSMIGVGRMLAESGYRALLADLRGHGRSSGDWLTYGVVDSRDLVQVLDHLATQALLDEPVGVFGCSYGAATSIQWAARDPRVKSVVAVAPFTTLYDAVTSFTRQFAPVWLVSKETISGAVAEAGRLANSLLTDAISPEFIGYLAQISFDMPFGTSLNSIHRPVSQMQRSWSLLVNQLLNALRLRVKNISFGPG